MIKRIYRGGHLLALFSNLKKSLFKTHCAFTLAEVLITLGVIGVVASMTIPSLIAKYQKNILENQFKKAYSEVSQAVLLLKAKEEINLFEYAKTYGSQNTLDKLMSQISGNTYGGSANLANFIKNFYRPKKLNKKSFTGAHCDYTNVYVSNNGIFYSMDDPPGNTSLADPKLCIDINGKKGPNAYGYDLFIFVFSKDGNIVPFTYKWTVTQTVNELDNISSQCSYNNTIPASCSYYALSNTSPEDSSKTYWNDFLK